MKYNLNKSSLSIKQYKDKYSKVIIKLKISNKLKSVMKIFKFSIILNSFKEVEMRQIQIKIGCLHNNK